MYLECDSAVNTNHSHPPTTVWAHGLTDLHTPLRYGELSSCVTMHKYPKSGLRLPLGGGGGPVVMRRTILVGGKQELLGAGKV